MPNTFNTLSTISIRGRDYRLHRLDGLPVEKLPFAHKILLENLLRTEDGRAVRAEDIDAIVHRVRGADREIAFTPSRVLLQDFTGVPAVVDLAAMRQAMRLLGGDAKRINPLQPVELVIDHSVQVDDFGSAQSLHRNNALEESRNSERYRFLKWGQRSFDRFRVVPPDVGIVHQVNLEHLARVVFVQEISSDSNITNAPMLYPDTVVGTDSHTTMVNGLGVLGWGVGGIEAEAAMLGQPVSMLIPEVVGVRLTGALREGTTATDLVLTVTQLLRKKGVVGKFVEFFGPGLAALPLADRATIANMAPEYGATCGIFPVDAETLRYLRFSGRSEEQVEIVEAYCKAQGLFATGDSIEAAYDDVVALDLSTIEPSLAGPTRPQDRVALADVRAGFAVAVDKLRGQATARDSSGSSDRLGDGSVVIAAITSCTNTSNPSVMIAAGLLAKKAVERGLTVKSWVKTSLAPGSRVVTEYLAKADLARHLERLGFFTVGYGCTTCIGNSGPLPVSPIDVSKEIEERGLVVSAVLSGNRNFEGRVHPEVRANYLASPPLVVAYALAGRVDLDLTRDPIGTGKDGTPVMLAELWPTRHEVEQAIEECLEPQMFRDVYATVFDGDASWSALEIAEGELYAWDDASTYVKLPPYFEGMSREPSPATELRGARVLAWLGDSITTDHISPAGSIKANGPAGLYLKSKGVALADFNSYGSRRGNHEVMVRGTFANVRLRNRIAPGTEGGVTRHLPDGAPMSIFDAATLYAREETPLVILAGKEYGSGSSRDWAAKGPKLLGVRAVIAESYERIHRSNLVGMGILPLQFQAGKTAESYALTGEETFATEGVAALFDGAFASKSTVRVTATRADGSAIAFDAIVRIDTPQEALYYRHGGILPYVLRDLLARQIA